jgi:hypothetical protein
MVLFKRALEYILNETRNKRVRGLVRKLNKVRRDQTKQIDILCNDMVAAHGDFVKQLKELTFAVKFYEAALAQPDMTSLLDASVDVIKNHIHGSSVSIFLLRDAVFDIHMADSDNPIDVGSTSLENYFTPDVVQEVSRSPHVCNLDELCTAGLQANPGLLATISAAAIPVGHIGDPVGFILVHRDSESPLQGNEIEIVTSVTEGLCSAIQKWQKVRSAV